MTTDPFSHSANALPAAATWIAALLTGSLATSVAVLAIGATGLAMLSGRVSLRDGARVVIGCFVLFGEVLKTIIRLHKKNQTFMLQLVLILFLF